MKQTISVRIFLALSLIVVIAGLIGVGWQFWGPRPETVDSDPVVAMVGNRSITLREVEHALALPLYLLETQRNQLLQQAIQKLIDERLLEAEASRKGVSLSQLLEEASQSESIARLANLQLRSSG